MLLNIVQNCVKEHIEKTYSHDTDRKNWLLNDPRRPGFMENITDKIIECAQSVHGINLTLAGIIEFVDGMAPLFCEVSLKYRELLERDRKVKPTRNLLVDKYGKNLNG